VSWRVILLARFALILSSPFLLTACATPRSSSFGSGTISRTEYDRRLCDLFAGLDGDQDGYLEPAEYQKRPTWIGPVKQMPDGRISVIDFLRAGDARFVSASRATPGKLTFAEFEALQRSQP
jgi:hypothetical protein